MSLHIGSPYTRPVTISHIATPAYRHLAYRLVHARAILTHISPLGLTAFRPNFTWYLQLVRSLQYSTRLEPARIDSTYARPYISAYSTRCVKGILLDTAYKLHNNQLGTAAIPVSIHTRISLVHTTSRSEQSRIASSCNVSTMQSNFQAYVRPV